MTRTGRTLGEYMAMGAVGRAALVSFVKYLPRDSALRGETDPDDGMREWQTRAKTNAILADIYDAFAAVHARKGRKPKPYPRPGGRARDRKVGGGAIPIRDFESWWGGAARR